VGPGAPHPNLPMAVPPFESYSATWTPCRCGSAILNSGPIFCIAPVPESLQGLFHNETFCSNRCVRAFILETLERLEALDTPAARDMMTDLHRVYAEVVLILNRTPDA